MTSRDGGWGHYLPIAVEEIEEGKLGDLSKVAKLGSSSHLRSAAFSLPSTLSAPPPRLEGTGGGGERAAGASRALGKLGSFKTGAEGICQSQCPPSRLPTRAPEG